MSTSQHYIRQSYPDTWGIWSGMKTRCSNAKRNDYAAYGGKGVRVCREWQESFEAFYADMGPRPGPEYSIGRLNSNGNYEPDNCAWQTKQEQANSTSRSRWIEFRGKRMTVESAINLTKLKRETVWSRLRNGWDSDAALTTPVQRRVVGKYDRKPKRKLSADDIRAIAELTVAGETRRSIAARFGVASSSIQRALRREGRL